MSALFAGRREESREPREVPLRRIAAALPLLACIAACSAAAPDGEQTATTSEAVCAEAYDWHDFPNGDQCVIAVDAFYSAHFGVGLPALCQYPTQNGCASCGACEFWEANAPSAATWDRFTTGTPQLFDMIVYPPTSGNAYGHVASVDHVDSAGNVYVMDDNYVAYQTKASCPHTVSWGAYGWYRLKILEDKPPQGWLDSVGCTQIVGWTYDPDTPSQAANVDVYFGGTAGSGAPAIHATANVHRPDLCTAIGSCDHGYVIPTPLSLMDGQAHAAYPYGIDTSGNGDNPLLQGAPKSFTCAPPAIPYSPAIKRHVTDPTVYAAWSFDALTDLAHLPDTTLDPIPLGPDIPAAPKLVTPDNGSGGVYLVDGSAARHVQDPASMTAWHFDWNAIVKMPVVQFQALAPGQPWPETPFLAQGSGPAIYMIDVTTPPPADAGAEAGRSEGGAVAGDDAGGVSLVPDASDVEAGSWAGDAPAGSSGGCSVPNQWPASGGWIVALAVFAGASARRGGRRCGSGRGSCQ